MTVLTVHQLHVRPDFTAELQTFWQEQLAQLASHQRPAILSLLAQRYGQTAVLAWRLAGCP